MKEKTDNILEKINRQDGFTVPEGYFEDFAGRMMAQLPPRPELETPVAPSRRSLWQTVRPFVYMAAMFAGVWCMLKMFTLMTGTDDSLSIENNPTLATAVSNERFVEDYVIDDISEWDIYDSMLNDSIDIENLGDSLLNLEETGADADSIGPDAPVLPQ